MRIDPEKCINCGICVPYCPMNCIVPGESSMTIDRDICVECGICKRNVKCPRGAFVLEQLTFPRSVRRAFSDPFGKHENTDLKHMGRGTEEIKTNDVTGIVPDMDHVAMAIELGRPSISTRFTEVQKITRAVAPFGVKFEKNNPVTPYIVDMATGEIQPDILQEKVMSAIVEFSFSTNQLPAVLAALHGVEEDIDTVFSVCIISKIEDDKSSVEDFLRIDGYDVSNLSAKTNLGLGRPLYRGEGAKA